VKIKESFLALLFKKNKWIISNNNKHLLFVNEILVFFLSN